MTADQPADNAAETWVVDVRPTCAKCERLAVVYTEQGTAYCARHATIFMTEWGGDDRRHGDSR